MKIVTYALAFSTLILALDALSTRRENALLARIVIEDATFMRRVAARDTVIFTDEERLRLRAGADANDYVAHRGIGSVQEPNEYAGGR